MKRKITLNDSLINIKVLQREVKFLLAETARLNTVIGLLRARLIPYEGEVKIAPYPAKSEW